MKIMVAGGAGYIGSHTCVALAQSGYDVVVVDSLVNSRREIVETMESIIDRKIDFIEVDVRDQGALDRVFEQYPISAVVNFAGYKSVRESISMPLDYYDNNLNCMISLLRCMSRHQVNALVFSSTAAVYGDSMLVPTPESASLAPLTAYGRTKAHIEEMLGDLARADASWKMAILRYFNPVGAHPGGLIGDSPVGHAENLMPLLTAVASGELEKLQVFGDDYDTPDGTAIRDYIHVMDLAEGHVKALQKLLCHPEGKSLTLNLGTGKGYSVLELLRVFEGVCGRRLPFEIVHRRAGDIERSCADPALAREEIGWEAKLDINDMCRDAWHWKLTRDGRQQG